MNQQEIEYLPYQNIAKLYKKVFNDICTQIQNMKIRTLSRLIHIMLELDELEAERVCNYFKINSRLLLDNDFYRALENGIYLLTSNPDDEHDFSWHVEKVILRFLSTPIFPLTIVISLKLLRMALRKKLHSLIG